MSKITLLATIFVLSAAGAAEAGGQEGSVGLGAEFQISGTGGASLNYDAGKFHVGGFFGMRDPQGGGNTDVSFGARFFYHVHSTAMSDFSVGGSVGMLSNGNGPMMDRTTQLFIEPSFQIRLFLAANVALSFTAGMAIGAVDATDNLVIDGQTTGIAGVHYYFF
jgi:hypothetical protein